MNDFKRNKYFPEKIASTLKFLNNLQPEWSRHVTIVHQTKDLHTADYTQLYDFLKYNQKEVDELRAERLAKTQDPLTLMANSNNSFKYPMSHPDLRSSSTYIQQPLPNNNNYNPQPSFNQNYMQQPITNLEDIIDPTAAINTELALMAKAFKLNYSTPTKNNQRISSNPRNRQIAQPGMNLGQDNQMQMVGGNGGGGNNLDSNAGQMYGIRCSNADQNPVVQNCLEIEGVIVVPDSYIRMEMQASISGTQSDNALVYDIDGSDEVQLHENYYNNEIFNMFTQEEQYTELLEPILEPHQVPQNDSNGISKVSSMEQDREDTRACSRESLKMQLLNKEIKLANYTKINHLSRVFVSQTAKSREELYLSNTFKTANVSKSISIPNEEFSDDTTPSVAGKFLNEHKALELEIEHLLRAVVSQDIMSIVQNNSVVDTSNLQTELDRTKER
ncbi:hypothetical protein Tco_0889948, partial [Tanacetum coccineum]